MNKLVLILILSIMAVGLSAQVAPIKKKGYVDEQKVLSIEAATPRAGYVSGPYRKTDGRWYEKDENGVESSMIGKFIDGSSSIYAVYLNGNVGIGTDTPTDRLSVVETTGNAYVGVQAELDNNSGFKFYEVGIERGNISYLGNTNTFEWNRTEGNLDFKNNGVSQMLLRSTGDVYVPTVLQVGVGGNVTESASLQLIEGGTWAAGFGFRFALDGVTNKLNLEARAGGGDTPETIMSFGRDNNYVGIGTESPTEALHVNGFGRFGNSMIGSIVGSSAYFGNASFFDGSSFAVRQSNVGDTYLNAKSGGTVNLGTNNSIHATVTHAGNFGIGTEAPAFISGGGLEIEHATNSVLRLQEQLGSKALEIRVSAGVAEISSVSSGTPLVLKTTGTEAVRIGTTQQIQFAAYTTDAILGTAPNILGTSASGEMVQTKISQLADGVEMNGDDGLTLRRPDGLTLIASIKKVANGVEFKGSQNANLFLNSLGNSADEGVVIQNNSVEIARFTEEGHVGIGTATPDAKLHVKSDLTGTDKAFFVEDATGDDLVTVLSNGHVGLEFVSPARTLEVGGDGISSPSGHGYTLGNSTQTEIGRWLSNSGVNYLRGTGTRNWQIGSETNGILAHFDNFNGRVGIGTETPTAKLHVIGNTIAEGTLSVDGWTFEKSPKTLTLFAENEGSSGHAFDIALGGWSTDAVEIFSSETKTVSVAKFSNNGNSWIGATGGNVGIGTTAPTSKLEVEDGDIAIGTNAMYYRNTNSSGLNIRMLGINSGNTAYVGAIDPGVTATIFNAASTNVRTSFYDSGAEAMRLNSTGLGIGTTTPASKLDVNGIITAGTNSASIGGTLLEAKYSNGSLANLFTARSSGAIGMGYGLSGSGSLSENGLTSTTTVSTKRGAWAVSDDAVFLYAPTQTTAVGSPVTGIVERFFIQGQTGNVGIGSITPDRKLLVVGANSTTPIISAISGTIAGNESAYLGAQNRSLFGYDGVRSAVTIADAGTNKPIVFDTNNAERMRITNDGNIGMGKEAPASNVHMYTSDTGVGSATGLTIEQGGTGDAKMQFLTTGTKRISMGIDNSDFDKFKISDGSDLGVNTLLTIDNGNVGIGTTAPTAELDVVGDAKIGTGGLAPSTLTVRGDGGGDDDLIFSIGAERTFYNAGEHSAEINFTRNAAAEGANIVFNVQENASSLIEAMRVDASGKIGIGINNPIVALDVESASATKARFGSGITSSFVRIFSSNTGISGLLLGDTDDFDAGRVLYDHATNKMDLYTSGGIAMTIDANRNVGIGTASPTAKLNVSDDVPILRLTSEGEKSVIGETIGAIEFFSEDASGSYPAVAAAIKAVNGSTFGSQTELAFFINADNPTPTEAVRIDASGQVGIGIASPTARLHVKGDALRLEEVAGSRGLDIKPAVAGASHIIQGVATSAGFIFKNNTIDLLNISGAGDIGIGIAAPTAKLHVKEAAAAARIRVESDAGKASIVVDGGNDDAELYFVNAGVSKYNFAMDVSAGNDIGLYSFTNSSTVFSYDEATDNFGIGTNTPTEKLEVDGTIKATDINFTGLPVYADEAAAIVGGLLSGDCYKTVTGELRIKL